MQTLALDLTQPYYSRSRALTNMGLVLGGSLFLALCAQISVPFMPVPLTLQTLAVLLVGALLGKRRALGAVLLYLAEGLAGFPVFAGGASGVAVLMGPRGGYLMGFAAAAFVVGMGAERGLDRSWKTAMPLFVLGDVVLFAFGLAWLREFVPRDQLLALGLWPFLGGEALKIAAAALMLPGAWRFTESRNSR